MMTSQGAITTRLDFSSKFQADLCQHSVCSRASLLTLVYRDYYWNKQNMSGYPNQPPAHQGIYPQFYNPVNGPPPQQYPAPGYPTPGQPAPGQYPSQPGFAYGQPGHPASMSYPGINPSPVAPSAPTYGYPGYPSVTPTQSFGNAVEWVPTTPMQAITLSDRAVVAGYEGHDGSPLWVIRARFEGDLIPGKLAVKHHAAYVAWGGNENTVQNIEVCCARPEKIRWQESHDGIMPPNAVVAGNTASGEPLFVGRAKEQGSLTPGKVHPSHKVMYMSFAGKEIPYKFYEVLCLV